MSAILDVKEIYSKLENICVDEKIDILENSMDEYDCYISFKFIRDHSFFNRLFLSRDKEYVIQFEKSDSFFIVTVSGKIALFEDVLKVLECKEERFNDIDELVSFLDKIESEDIVAVVYSNGVSYHYEIGDNSYGFALSHYDFAFDGFRYHYRANSCENFYEVMKNINKNIDMHKKLMKDTDIVIDMDVTGKNTYIQEIREVYNRKGKKELFIIYRDSSYYIALKIGEELFLYKYSNEMYLRNIIPELFNLYLEGVKGSYNEECRACLGRSFYMNTISANNKLFIYNIDEVELNFYLSYLQALSKNGTMKQGHNYELGDGSNKRYNSANMGYVNILFLSVGLLLFGVFVFIMTLNFMK